MIFLGSYSCEPTPNPETMEIEMIKVFIDGVESTRLSENNIYVAYLIWWAAKYEYLYLPSFEGMEAPQPIKANYCLDRKGILRGFKYIDGRKYEVYM